MTSKALGLNKSPQPFIYDGGIMRTKDDSGAEYQLIYNSDGTMNMNVMTSEGMGATFILSKKEGSENEKGSGETDQIRSGKTTGTYKELKRGDKSDEVRELQERLIELNWLEGKADGNYGPKTEEAVRAFQKGNRLKETGVADKITQKMLFSDGAKKKKVYNTMSFDTLSRNPDNYIGELYKFSGKCLQVLEDGNDVQLRIATKDGYDDIVYVTYTRDDGESRILEDDKLNVYGVYKGLISYESIFGQTITLPLFAADRIKVK